MASLFEHETSGQIKCKEATHTHTHTHTRVHESKETPHAAESAVQRSRGKHTRVVQLLLHSQTKRTWPPQTRAETEAAVDEHVACSQRPLDRGHGLCLCVFMCEPDLAPGMPVLWRARPLSALRGWWRNGGVSGNCADTGMAVNVCVCVCVCVCEREREREGDGKRGVEGDNICFPGQ